MLKTNRLSRGKLNLNIQINFFNHKVLNRFFLKLSKTKCDEWLNSKKIIENSYNQIVENKQRIQVLAEIILISFKKKKTFLIKRILSEL